MDEFRWDPGPIQSPFFLSTSFAGVGPVAGRGAGVSASGTYGLAPSMSDRGDGIAPRFGDGGFAGGGGGSVGRSEFEGLLMGLSFRLQP